MKDLEEFYQCFCLDKAQLLHTQAYNSHSYLKKTHVDQARKKKQPRYGRLYPGPKTYWGAIGSE